MAATGDARVRSVLEAGLAAHRAGRLDEALSAYEHALTLAPDHADARNLAGVALLETGRAGDSIPHFEWAAKTLRNNAQVLGNLAQAYLAVRRFHAAERAFRNASRIAPAQAQLQIGIAVALAAQGKVVDAEGVLRQLAVRHPNSALVWLNYGHVLRDQERLSDALECYRKATATDPGYVEAHNSAGRVLHVQLEFAGAEAAYRRSIALAPDDPAAHINLASVLIDVGRFAEAEIVCRRLLEAARADPQVHTMLATSLAHQGRLLEAREFFFRAADLEPDEAKATRLRVVASLDTGHIDEVLRGCAKLMAHGRDVDLKVMLAVSLLGYGQLQDGWREYIDRPAAVRLQEKYAALLVRELPEMLAGSHICLLREQGLGDEIFFLRYAALLADRGARVTYRAGAKLVDMVGRCEFLSSVVGEDEPVPPADLHMLIADLPYAIGAGPASTVAIAPTENDGLAEYPRRIVVYWPQVAPTISLRPLPERMEEMRALLATIGPAPYIGLTWRAGTRPEDQLHNWVLHKSISAEGLAAALDDVPGTLLSLQRNTAPGEIEHLQALTRRSVQDLSHLNDDLEGMLGLLALLDEYIGVSNTNMHLRAAVGRDARVLVPQPAEWRWLQFGQRSPWFPGFHIYRQKLNGDWSRAIQALHNDLRERYAARNA